MFTLPIQFSRGAMINPSPIHRQEAIDLTIQAADVAIQLGCNEVVIWSAFDDYNYPFQISYEETWSYVIKVFQECCDTRPTIQFSIEYRPTDKNTRYFTVPSTVTAILLVKDINRTNMGLMLDVGHMLMARENSG